MTVNVVGTGKLAILTLISRIACSRSAVPK
jgi:hypothetical protein